jgi:hypothetical protein
MAAAPSVSGSHAPMINGCTAGHGFVSLLT